MKIKHILTNNQLKVTLTLTPKKHPHSRSIIYRSAEVIELCKSQSIPAGSLISRDSICSNESEDTCERSWIFSVDRTYKKSLTSPSQGGSIKNTKIKSKPTARSRASNIVKSSRKKRVQDAEVDVTKPEDNKQ